MGIDLKALVTTVFGVVGSTIDGVLVEATYKNFVTTAYDTSSGETITVYATTVIEDAIKTAYKSYELDEPNITGKDQKLLIPFNSLPISPTPEDTVSIAGEEWAVKDFRSPPAASVWIFQIRSPGG